MVELTALPFDAAAAAFGARASADERRRAYRLPHARARAFVHAHGALYLSPTAGHRSISYATGRAWAAISEAPVGLDVVAAVDDGVLDDSFVGTGDARACTGLGFPARLAAWAAKEAAAKLTGEVGRKPERWRLGRAGPERSIVVRFARPERGILAALARLRQGDAR